MSSNNLRGRGKGRVSTSLGDDMDLVDLSYSPRNDESNDEIEVSLEYESDVENLGEDDEPLEDTVPAFIHEDFDPYEGPVWEDDCEDMDNYLQRLYKNGEFYKEKAFGKIEIKAWQLYTDKYHLRDVIRDYCIQSGFVVVVEVASNHKYTIRCNDERCTWRLHASKLVDCITLAIKSIQGSEHKCIGLQTRNSIVTAKWASKALMEDIRANNEISAKTLNRLLWTRFRVQMSKSTLYRAKQAALQQIHGGHDVSYTYLPAYYDAIIPSNPNSFAHCSWHKSIDKACRDLWPGVGRRYCTKQLSVNFKKAFPGPNMFQPFRLASGAYNDFTFKKAMDQIDKHKAGARVWLANLGDQDRWSKHKFNPSLKCDVHKTNFVESFNATQGIDRCRPVLTLLE
ncbi:Uracil-DNA glycosylase, partial [Bienertia sinuspersici]